MCEYRVYKSGSASVKGPQVYGIKARHNWTVIESIPNITTDQEKLQHLVFRCNHLQLSPLHLRDVVEDFLSED